MSFIFSEFIKRSSIDISDQWPHISFWIVQGCYRIGVERRAAKIPQEEVPLVSCSVWNCCSQGHACWWEFQLRVLPADSFSLVLSGSSSVASGGGTLLSCLLLETSVDDNSSYSSPTSFTITLVSWQAAFSSTSGGKLIAPSLFSSSWAKRVNGGHLW